jgi:hypothetical protein
MSENLAKFCFDADWNSSLPLMIVFSLSYGVFIPCFYFLKFFQNRSNQMNPKFVEHFGVLCYLYRSEFFWWELVLFFKKMFIVVLAVFIQATRSEAQILYVIQSAMFLFLLAEAVCKPYKTAFLSSLSFM